MNRLTLVLISSLLFALAACDRDRMGPNPDSPYTPASDNEPLTFVECDSLGNLSVYTGIMRDFRSSAERSVNSPLNGQACQNSPNDTFTLHSMSQATQLGFISPSASPSRHRSASAAASGRISLVNPFPLAMPVPFGPPLFANGATPPPAPACDASGAVLHVATCPLRLISTIPVVSHPLQARLTPDGAQLWIEFWQSNQLAVFGTLPSPKSEPSQRTVSPAPA
jgi:hypothetical protein